MGRSILDDPIFTPAELELEKQILETIRVQAQRLLDCGKLNSGTLLHGWEDPNKNGEPQKIAGIANHVCPKGHVGLRVARILVPSDVTPMSYVVMCQKQLCPWQRSLTVIVGKKDATIQVEARTVPMKP